MNFRQGSRDEPEINLIPFIDVLLVVLIFMVLTTTYSKYTELQVSLPVADAEAIRQRRTEIVVAVSHDGRFSVNGHVMDHPAPEELAKALSAAAGQQLESVVVINADAAATHQSVVSVMDASRRAGLAKITFSTQTTSVVSPGRASKRP